LFKEDPIRAILKEPLVLDRAVVPVVAVSTANRIAVPAFRQRLPRLAAPAQRPAWKTAKDSKGTGPGLVEQGETGQGQVGVARTTSGSRITA